MRLGLAVLLTCIALTLAGRASADAAPEHRGFQLAFRPGVAVPFGKAVPDVKMSDLTSVQYVPVLLDIGGKVLPQLFIGGYVGLGFGSTGGELDRVCQANGGDSCSTFSLRFGFEAMSLVDSTGVVSGTLTREVHGKSVHEWLAWVCDSCSFP